MCKLKNSSDLWLPLFLGMAAFILVTGGKIIWPSYVDWLFLHGDSEDGLFAWQFYRHTPLFQSPLGANFPYGMGRGGQLFMQNHFFYLHFHLNCYLEYFRPHFNIWGYGFLYALFYKLFFPGN